MAAGKFEEALTRIDEIVRALEKGDLSLEESVKRFEEGVKLSKNCLKMLEEAQRKVDILMADEEGKKKLRPFSEPRAGRDKQGAAPGKDEEEFEEDDDESEDSDEESDNSGDDDNGDEEETGR